MSIRGFLQRNVWAAERHRATARLLEEIGSFDPAARPNPYLAALVRDAAANVPYYRDTLAPFADPVASFAALPLIDRQTIRREFERMRHDTPDRAGWFTTTTSGSTGMPLSVIHDTAHKNWVRATEAWHFRNMLGIDPTESPMVVFWASSEYIWGKRRSLSKTIDLWLGQTDLLGATRFTPAEMREGIEAINRRRPVVIKSYASPLYQIAKHIRANNIRIHRPRVVFSLAETMRPFMRETIEDVFGAPVRDFYGTREVGPIAGQCAHGRMHLFSFHAHLELLDDHGRPVPPGGEGRVVLTALHNRAMPLLRYEIADRAVAAPATPCPCGCPLPSIERVVGRRTDYFPTANGTLVYGGHFIKMMYDAGWVDEFRVIQPRMDVIEIHYVPARECLPDEKAFIETRVRNIMGPACAVEWHRHDALPPGPYGKHMYIISNVAGTNAPKDPVPAGDAEA